MLVRTYADRESIIGAWLIWSKWLRETKLNNLWIAICSPYFWKWWIKINTYPSWFAGSCTPLEKNCLFMRVGGKMFVEPLAGLGAWILWCVGKGTKVLGFWGKRPCTVAAEGSRPGVGTWGNIDNWLGRPPPGLTIMHCWPAVRNVVAPAFNQK